MAQPMSTVADLIVRQLVDAGVRTLFGMPGGGSSLDVLDAAARAGMPFVMSHTETAGALMASAQAELTGKPGASIATLGPGVASLANGLAHARLDRVPLVVMTDGLPVAVRDVYEHQRIDHAALLGPVVKASVTLDGRHAASQVRAALRRAVTPPAGPVHLDCPSDIAQGPASETKTADPSGVEASGGSTEFGPPASLARTRRPVFIAGLGARAPETVARLRTLCERRGAPVLVTYKAKGVVPDDHPCFAGVFTHAAIDEPFVRSGDLIVGVGLDPVELLPRPWHYPQPLIVCGTWPIGERHVRPAVQATGDLSRTLDALDELLPRDTAWTSGEIRGQAERRRAAVRIEAPGFAPYRVIDAVSNVCPNARVTVDAGAHMFPVTALWPVRRPLDLLISNGLSTMGYALPAAIGAALLEPDRRVIAFTGDGGLLMCLAELSTAARARLPVTVVVFGDRSLSLIRIKQERKGFRSDGVAIGAVDWPAVARGFGLSGARATDAASLERAVEEAEAAGGPALVEAVVDPSVYPETLRAVRG